MFKPFLSGINVCNLPFIDSTKCNLFPGCLFFFPLGARKVGKKRDVEKVVQLYEDKKQHTQDQLNSVNIII